MLRRLLTFFIGTILFVSVISLANTAKITVKMYSTDTQHKPLGTITLMQNRYGVLVLPNLQGLTPGIHGMHVHTNPSCDKQGKAAGGHFDPHNTKMHLGPYNGAGHLGDLPALFVNQQGQASQPLLVPRLHMDEMRDHALIIHAGGDNYSDQPKALGGGGARVACGIIK